MNTSDPVWSIIAHGGAKTIAEDQVEANRAGCLQAVAAGSAILQRGGRALDAVEAAISILEANTVFNAGFGAVRADDGRVELDAAIMDGETLSIGAIAAARTIAYPIRAARKLLALRPVLLSGEGADLFARDQCLELRPAGCGTPGERAGHDTVGCVALDKHGHLASGTSTGGLEGQLLGRVGDSPLARCGFYADDDVGAVSLSGDGESITRITLAARAIFALESLGVSEAVKSALAHIERVGGEAGIIALDGDGQFGIVHNSDHFALALANAKIQPRAATHRDQLKDILDA